MDAQDKPRLEITDRQGNRIVSTGARGRGNDRHAKWASAQSKPWHFAESRLGGKRPREHECGGTARGDAGDAANGEKRMAGCVAAAGGHVYGSDHALGRRYGREGAAAVCKGEASDPAGNRGKTGNRESAHPGWRRMRVS